MTLNSPQNLYALFEEQARQRSAHLALGFDNQRITYGELNEKAGQIAAKLVDCNIVPGDIVVVNFQTPYEMAAGIMGVLKAGGAYVPVNSAYPGEYISQVTAAGKVKYLLTYSSSNDNIEFNGNILSFENPPPAGVQRGNLLSVIYVSHSSGRPQGISLSQETILNWIKFNLEKLKIDFSHTLFVSSTRMEISFPIWLVSLVTGGSVHFYQPKNQTDGAELAEHMQEKKCRSLVCPLSFLQRLIEKNDYKDIFSEDTGNIVSLGENTFDAGEFKTFIKDRNIRWHNYYGFPVIHLVTSLFKDRQRDGVDGADGAGFKHAGKLAAETRPFILDRGMQFVSIGKPGELYVSGKGVMDGYYRNEQLNTTCYLDSPQIPGTKLYKTGYKACWLPDGKISLLGRTDNLVDINAYPLALEEVEAALFKHPLISDCAVGLKRTNENRPRLTAYVVLNLEKDIRGEHDQIEEFLKKRLPIDIFPIGFVRLSSLPRTAAGHPDREYLEEVGFFDTIQAGSLESEIKKDKGVRHAAVLIKEEIGRPTPLHLRDFLPEPRESTRAASESEPGAAKEPKEVKKDEPDIEHELKPLAVIHGGELEEDSGDPKTLAESLEKAARENRDQGVIYIQPDGSDYFQTYREIWEEAQKVLAGLKKSGLGPGDKAIFQFDRNEDFVSAFWGCVLGGIVPVPLTVPKLLTKGNIETDTLYGIWKALDTPPLLMGKNLSSHPFYNDFPVENIEDLRNNPPDHNRHKGSPGDLAILLFTSGSTGKPKGVTQTHHSILSREKGTALYNRFDSTDISVNWMPLEHVGGVVMFHVRDILVGCRQVQVKVDYILEDPLRWLDIISRYKATNTWAPNFAYALVNERLEKELTRGVEKIADRRWDLSGMRFILNAGEAINAQSTARFLNLLAPYGLPPTSMKPCWGMSETCSGVVYSHSFTPDLESGVHRLDKRSLSGSIKRSTEEADNVTFVELGKPIPGVSIRIVDAGDQPVREDIVGRLQVKGLTVTGGYYRNPELNSRVFTADGWLDTGDLGFNRNGCMTITGRAKDVIIIHGVNYNNVELEAIVEEVEGVEVSYTAACAVRDAGSETDRVIIFYNSLYKDFNRILEQVKEIRKKFVEKTGLILDYVIPAAKEEIPKTNIGKIQRTKLARRFEAGDFDPILKEIDIGLENENTLPQWFFEKSWQVRVLPPGEETVSGSDCLVFEDDRGLGGGLIGRLEENGCRCIRVKAGRGFNKINSSGYAGYEINPGEPGDYRRLFTALSRDNIRVRDIFHLYCFDDNRSGSKTGCAADVLENAQTRGIYSLLHLIQALTGEVGQDQPVRLFVISSNAQSVSEKDNFSYEKCALPGFLKSVSLELSQWQCRHIDIDPEPGAVSLGDCARYVYKEWKNLRKENEVAYRDGRRLVSSLSRLRMKEETLRDLPLERGGIYLVTGGLGGLGTHVCKMLMQSCGAKLVIVGRTSLPQKEKWNAVLKEDSVVARRIRAYLDIETVSSDFIYGDGDVCDKSFLCRLIDRAESRWNKSISGVFHLAGYGNLEEHWAVMDKRRISAETPETFAAMFHPKVYGAVTLHQILKDRPEAIFVAFSSTSAFFGAATFSAYSAANSLLNGFCLSRGYGGYPNTCCLSWSSWDDVGMSENNPLEMRKAMQQSGYKIIPLHQGLNSMLIALRCNRPLLALGLDSRSSNIRRFLNEYPSGKQKANVYYTGKQGMEFSDVQFRQTVSAAISRADKKGNTLLELHKLEEMPLVDGVVDYKRLEELDTHLKESVIELDLPETETQKKLTRIWKQLLAISQVGIKDNFFEKGGNSLKAAALVSVIHKELNIEVPLANIFRLPTIKELSAYLDEAEKTGFSPIEPAKEKDYYALSSAQKRLYVLQQMKPDSTTYNLPRAVELEGEPGKEKLAETFKKLIKRHESLRTSFDIVDGEPVQEIHPEVEFAIEYYDRELPTISNFIRPFDLSRAPLLRVGLIRTGEAGYILVTDMHHIIADGVSHNILTRDFIAFYRGEELPALRIQYKDYSEWQNRMKEKGEIKTQEEYWIKQFEGEIPVLDLPADFPRPDELSFEGSAVEFDISEGETGALEALAQEEGATMYMAVLALFNILLGKLTGREDIIVGTDTAGRRHADLENIIGMFVNTLVLRNYPGEDKTFTAFLREVKQRTLEAFENQDYQFENLVEKVVVKRDASRNPLFDIMFTYYNMAVQPGDIPGLKIKQRDYEEKKTAKFDLIFHAAEIGRGIHCTFEYGTKLFKEEKIKKYIKTFKEILSAVMENKEIKLKDIPVTHSLMAIESNILLEDRGEFGF